MSKQKPCSVELIKEGARKVLTMCLNLYPEDNLAIFWDETTQEVAAYFIDAAKELRIKAHSCFVSIAKQKEFIDNPELPIKEREALDNSRGIITCVSNHTEGTAFRKYLIKTGTDVGKRFGHMPGATVDVLASAMNMDYKAAASRCDDLLLALVIGKRVRLESYILDSKGNKVQSFNLNFDIGGFSRPPISSTGIIPPGTWGNLPGGESFIAPIEDTANGTFVLNGAFKQYIIEPPDYLLLYFEGGRLMDFDGTKKVGTKFKKIIDYAKQKKDLYYNSLAELGIGVNEGIKELTGNALFDEKCAGTAHIAIGDSSGFGGKHSSHIHEDLITRKPSIWIDDKPILKNGKNAMIISDWRVSLENDDWRVPLEKIIGHHKFSASNLGITRKISIKGKSAENGALLIKREVGSRVCEYSVAEYETSKLLAKVYSHIPEPRNKISFQDLFNLLNKEIHLTERKLKALLGTLEFHQVISMNQDTYLKK
jgi:leucyl aminopeptidase (aminopeptidase T)